MSSFINNAKTFNSVQQGIEALLNDSRTHSYPFKKFGLDRYDNNPKQIAEKLKQLFDSVRELQVISWHFQYEARGEYNVNDLRKSITEQIELTKLETKIKRLRGAALLKNFQCIMYQIEEEGIDRDFAEAFYPDLNIEETLDFLNVTERQIALETVMRGEEYDAADWGLDND